MFTQEIFICFFVFVIGNIFGKFFKKFNPFFILFGLILFSPLIFSVLGWDRWFYTSSLVAGIVFVFGSPLRFVASLWTDTRMNIQLAKARREASRQTRDQHRHQETGERFGQEQGPKLRSQETHEQKRAKPGFDPQNDKGKEGNHQQAWESPNQQKEAEEEIRRQEQEAIARINRQKVDIEADLRRKAETLHQREEALKQEQARTYKEQMNQQEATEQAELDPAKIQDAYRILGVASGLPLLEYRKTWVGLVRQYHPDKTAHLGAKLQKVALLETQKLNKAFETIKKSF